MGKFWSFVYLIVAVCTSMIGYAIHHNLFWSVMGAAVVGFLSFLFLFMSGLGLYKTKRTLRLGRRPKQF
jgi:membrane protein YdbS with pleckstrin-like domain